MQRRGGIVFLKINGTQYDVKGQATYNIVGKARTTILGQDGRHGFKEMPTVVSLELSLTDSGTLDLKALATIENATITLELANQKVITLRNAWATGDWDASSEEGEIKARFEALSAQEVL